MIIATACLYLIHIGLLADLAVTRYEIERTRIHS